MEELNKILKMVLLFKEKYKTVWFRGHSNIDYKLNSGLYRLSSEKSEVKDIESNIFNCFINYGDLYCNQFNESKEWNSLFLMQHYGMYTRLLDWTDSFITALYFAMQGVKEDVNACIWMIAPIEINKRCKTLYEKGIDEGYDNIGLLTIDTLPKRIKDYRNIFEKTVNFESFAIVPRRSNERLVSQNGFFTVQGSSGQPLDAELHDYIGEFIIKIAIKEEIFDECKRFVNINGINSYSLYGGIEGLCCYIKNELLKLELKNI